MANVYITEPGDQWDMIAKKVYGSELRADFLMASNFPLIETFEFDAGVEINTPPLPDTPAETLPAWRAAT